MKTLKLPSGATYGFDRDGKRVCTGSQMGRRNEIPADYMGERLRLQRLPFVDWDYDRWGAYWGAPANVWCVWGESQTEQVRVFVRANSRAETKQKVKAVIPKARFYR